MCGLFGAILQKPLTLEQRCRVEDAVQFMAVASAVRGSDSAGIARADVTGRVHLYKDIGPSDRLVRRKQWRSVVRGVTEDTFAIIGHTRKKTHGAIVAENAHPHLFSDKTNVFPWLLGTHNGTVQDHKQYGPYENDSRNLFHTLAMSSDWSGVLRRLGGTYAVVCAVPDMVVMARNSFQSPLYAGSDAEMGLTLYASTEDVLRSAMAIARIGKETYGAGMNIVYRFPARPKLQDSRMLSETLYSEETKSVTTSDDVRHTFAVCVDCKNTTDMKNGLMLYGRFRCYPCYYHAYQQDHNCNYHD